MSTKIAIADDDQGILDVMRIILEENNYEVMTISDPKNIIHDLNNAKPKLLLLDIWMSGFDGKEIAKEIKSKSEVKDIPIILVSAKNDLQRSATECDVEDYLAKPFDIEDLISKVKKYTT